MGAPCDLTQLDSPLGFSTGAKADSELPALEALAAVFASQTEEMAKFGGFNRMAGETLDGLLQHPKIGHGFSFFFKEGQPFLEDSNLHGPLETCFDQAVRRLYCILATNLRSAEYRELVQEARLSGCDMDFVMD